MALESLVLLLNAFSVACVAVAIALLIYAGVWRCIETQRIKKKYGSDWRDTPAP